MLKGKVKPCSKHCDLMRVKPPICYSCPGLSWALKFSYLCVQKFFTCSSTHCLPTFSFRQAHFVTLVYCSALLSQSTCTFSGAPFSITSFPHCHPAHADNTILWQISKTAHSQFSVLAQEAPAAPKSMLLLIHNWFFFSIKKMFCKSKFVAIVLVLLKVSLVSVPCFLPFSSFPNACIASLWVGPRQWYVLTAMLCSAAQKIHGLHL